MLPANDRRPWPSLLQRLILALLLAGALLLPPPLGPSVPRPALAATAGEIYVVDLNCCGGFLGGVIRVDPATGAQTLVSSLGNFVDPGGIAIAANGDLLVADRSCCGGTLGGVIRVNPSTGAQTILSPGNLFVDPFGIAIAANGDLLVTDFSCCGGGGVIRVNPATGAQTLVSSNNNLTAPVGIAIAANGDLVVTDAFCCGGFQGGVIRVNPATGAQTIVSSGNHFASPDGIAIAANGDLLVADASCCGGNLGGVIRVNPATGAQTVVSSGNTFVDPVGIAIAANGDLLVADQSCCVSPQGGVIRVNPTTGAQTVVSPGYRFEDPRGIAIAPVLAIDSPSVVEGQSGATNLTFTVSLAPYTSQTVSVQYATADGTAQAGSDYVATSGTLTFNPGETTKTFAVSVLGDTLVEPDETVLLNLTNPLGANLAQPQASGTILNDDLQLTLSIAAAGMPEGNSGTSSLTFTVSLSNPSSQTVTVQYATADGTAQAGSDYTAATGTLTFNPGETTKTIAVAILGDALVEPDETFTVTLSAPTGATIATAQATGTIRNDDSACTPRPRVTTNLVAGGGALQVHVESTQLNTQAPNPLQQLRFGTFQNATVTVGGQPVVSGQAVTLPASTFGADFTVRRLTPGQPTTVPFAVVDGCGQWQTFVGGGASAGF